MLLRYGLLGNDEYTQKEVAEKLGIKIVGTIGVLLQAHNEKISESELNNFMKNKKISDAKIAKEMLLNDKINNISQKTMNEIKQFYYVEIKEL